jgi:hypothetical protein
MGRVRGARFLTHDVNTVPAYARERLSAGRPLAGVVLVRKTAESSRIVEDLMTIAIIGTDLDVTGQVLNVSIRS